MVWLQASAPGRRVLLPREVWPQYKCNEHSGATPPPTARPEPTTSPPTRRRRASPPTLTVPLPCVIGNALRQSPPALLSAGAGWEAVIKAVKSGWATIEFVGKNNRGQQWAEEQLLLSLLRPLREQHCSPEG